MEFQSPLDRLWHDYMLVFQDFDDLTLARWLSQTLGQIAGKVWRLSHPLIGTYRLAAQLADERQIWLKRLANVPPAYSEAECCRAPLLPLLTRSVLDSGLICEHCGGTAIAFADIPTDVKSKLRSWAKDYAAVHEVAHWDERQQKAAPDYDAAFEKAATQAESTLAFAGRELAPLLLVHYPAVIWEDQDECLEVRPEDVVLE